MTRQGKGVQRVQLGDEWMYVAYVPLRQANWSLALVVPKNQLETQLDALNALASVVAGVLAIASLIGCQQIRLLEQAEDRSAELVDTNVKLQQEVQERQRVEAELLHAQAKLEGRVAARTAELETANHILQDSETQLKHQANQLAQTLQELQHTQSQLVQTEKMSSLGQLIAGVAHEINNPVNFIHANLPYADQYLQDLIQLLKIYQAHYPNPAPEVQAKTDEIELDFLIEDLSKILKSMHLGTERIRQLVLSLRNFSRLDEAAMKEVDIHEGLENTLLILQTRLKPKPDYPGIQVIRDYTNPALVECYPGQLNQVFMNILVNAIDALEEANKSSASRFAIDTLESSGQQQAASGTELGAVEQSAGSNLTHQESTMWQYPPLPLTFSFSPTIWIHTVTQGKDWVEIRISNNGPGMAEDVRCKVFDPFFTTKPVGKGTGIGLSISYQIVVEKHGGQLQCYSTPDNGAEFVIRIPIHQSNCKELMSDADRSQVNVDPAMAEGRSPLWCDQAKSL
ncbi:MAG: hypothetical protein HC866_16045 [Leptolyngbyaceae cyanobacterium RU_5_1]|nr:hypothetical protein [Leptolyngbyaceae cyanobacterium RU_5_1]